MPSMENEIFNRCIMNGCCDTDWLEQQMLNERPGILLLDCRAPNDFNISHINNSIHVTIPSLMLRRLKKGNLPIASVISCNEAKEEFTERCKRETVVVYDECSTDVHSNPSSVVTLLVKRLQEDGCRVCLLKGGFKAFHTLYPHHCDGVDLEDQEQTIFGLQNLNISEPERPVPHISCKELVSGEEKSEGEEDSPSSTKPFPVEVLPYLFLGNAQNSADLECLYRNGIKYILNVTPNVPNTFEDQDTFKYMQIPITDHWSQNLSAFFHEAISFIDEAREKKCGVLVHCLAGISRSVTVTVAYLMCNLSLSLNDAYDYVKKCKPNISPNFNFMGQLLDFESELNINRCVCSSPTDCECRQVKTYFTSPGPSGSGSTPSSSTSTGSSMITTSSYDSELSPLSS